MTLPAVIVVTGSDWEAREEVTTQLVSDYGYVPRRLGAAVDDLLLDLNPLLRSRSGETTPLFDVVYSVGWAEATRMFDDLARLRRTLRERLPEHTYPEVLADNITTMCARTDRWVIPDVINEVELAVIQNWYGEDDVLLLEAPTVPSVLGLFSPKQAPPGA